MGADAETSHSSRLPAKFTLSSYLPKKCYKGHGGAQSGRLPIRRSVNETYGAGQGDRAAIIIWQEAIKDRCLTARPGFSGAYVRLLELRSLL